MDCGRSSRLDTAEPDGKPRCGGCSQDPEAVKRRSGRHKERQAEKRKNAQLVRQAVAAGVIPPVARKQGRGDQPFAEGLARLEAMAAEQGVPVEEVARASSIEPADDALPPLLGPGESLAMASVRVKVLNELAKATWMGILSPGQATAIERMVRAAQAEPPDANDEPIVVQLVEVTSEDQAEAILRGEYGPLAASDLQ